MPNDFVLLYQRRWLIPIVIGRGRRICPPELLNSIPLHFPLFQRGTTPNEFVLLYQRRWLIPIVIGGGRRIKKTHTFEKTLFEMKTHSNNNLKTLVRQLRKNGTKGEAILWRDVLKARQMRGYQFNRQFVIDNYIVDFISRKLKLIIEIDGSSHISKSAEDFERQNYLEKLEYQIIRFSEAQVVCRIDEVVSEIVYVIECIEEQSNLSNPPLITPFSKGEDAK